MAKVETRAVRTKSPAPRASAPAAGSTNHVGQLNSAGRRFAIVVSRFNEFIGDRLVDGALDAIRRTGGSVDDVEIDHNVSAAEKFFRPGYTAHLVNEWIPSLTGIEEKLKAGAKVADVGCGHGASTILMAQAYPNSRFYGFDSHPASVENARDRDFRAVFFEQDPQHVGAVGFVVN